MKIAELINQIQTEPRAHIIFLCAGNICRSPYASMMFEKMLNNSQLSQQKEFLIQSGGFIKQREVMIHELTRRCLLDDGIPEERIKQHTPRIMRKHKEDMRLATVLFVMTESHRDVLVPAKYRHKVLLLSQVKGDDNIANIPDPALITDYNEYRALMNIIKGYLEHFLKIIE